MANLNFFIENGRDICENQQKLRVQCKLHIWEEKLTGASSQKQSWIPLHCSTWWKKIQLCTIIRKSPRHSPSRLDLLAHDAPPLPGNCSPSRCQWAMMANCQWQDPLPDQSKPPFSAGDRSRTCHYCFFVFSSRLRL